MTTEDAAADAVKLTVDKDKCIGSGQCEMLEEQTFVVGEDDDVTAEVIGTGMLPLDRAEKVIDLCPSQAISKAPQ